MKTVVNILVALSLIVISCQLHAQEVSAKLGIKTIDNFVDIGGYAQNTTNTFKDEFSYLLFSLKKGINGNYSRNSQSGEFSLEPNEDRELSSLKVNIQKGEELKVYLFIRKFGQLVSKDSALVFSAERKEKDNQISETEIEIKGLVTDDVITKLGKDFYDYFYQKYNASGNQYPFIINITEKPSFGRSSKISLSVDDRLLFEFMSRPNDEFIQAAAIQALRKVNAYASRRKLLFKNKKI